MSAYKSRKIENSLTDKGFKLSYGSNHKKLTLYVDGKKTRIFTFLSHGTKTYNDSLLSKMKKHLHIEKSELCDLIDCPLSGQEYIDKMVEKGIIIL